LHYFGHNGDGGERERNSGKAITVNTRLADFNVAGQAEIEDPPYDRKLRRDLLPRFIPSACRREAAHALSYRYAFRMSCLLKAVTRNNHPAIQLIVPTAGHGFRLLPAGFEDEPLELVLSFEAPTQTAILHILVCSTFHNRQLP